MFITRFSYKFCIFKVMKAIRPYRKPNLKAPRFGKKKFDILNSLNKDFYKALKSRYPEFNKYSNYQISKFIETFNKRIAQEVIDNRNGVRLPEGLGFVIAGICKISKKTAENNIDYGTSNKLGVAVRHINTHSEQY